MSSTALTSARMTTQDKWTRKQLVLATGSTVYQGGMAVGDSATGTVKKAAAGVATMVMLGVFAESIANSAAGALVNVDFLKEKTIIWMDQDADNPVTTLFTPCYFTTDHTVGSSSNSGANAKAGTVLAIDSVLGVAFDVEGL